MRSDMRKKKRNKEKLTGVFLSLVASASLLMAEDSFYKIRLSEAIEIALKQSPDLATAQERVKAARAALRQADSIFYPQLRLSETYTASDNPVQGFMMTLNQRSLNLATANFNHPDDMDNFNTKLLASYPLYSGGKNRSSQQATLLQLEAKQETYEAVQNELIYEVTRSFLDILKAREFVRVEGDAVTHMRTNFEVAESRFSQGAALKTDVLDARVKLAEAEENLVRARNAHSIAESIFRNVLGLSSDDLITAAEIPEASGDFSAEHMESLLSGAADRPEIISAEKTVSAAKKQLKAAQAGHAPRISALASYDLDSGDASHFEDSWFAGLGVELDLFDGYLTQGRILEARANLEIAENQLRKIMLSVRLEVKQAQLNLEASKARLQTTSQAVLLAEESVKITRDRYANGLVLMTQLLDSEAAFTAARQRHITAASDYQLAVAALKKALGNTKKELLE